MNIKYQIFISSTFEDLKEEREGIIKAILELYHIPIGMEMFSAEDEEQWEIIRRTIDSSDYYILILGLRYGSKSKDGISFTQKEYEYALERKIPILAFIMDENAPLSADKRDDDLSEIKNFRDLVSSNDKMASFWKNKDQLISKVMASLTKQIMQKPGVGWVRGDNAETSKELSKELTALSKENRELRELVEELESKVSIRKPDLKVNIDLSFSSDNFYSYKKIDVPVSLSMNDVSEHLMEYLTPEDIENYNNLIPTREAIDNYNQFSEKLFRIENCSKPLSINVLNAGSCIAKNVNVSIEFPEEIKVYRKNEKFEKLENIIPDNPIKKATEKYNKKINRENLNKLGMGATLGLLEKINMGTKFKFSDEALSLHPTVRDFKVSLHKNIIDIDVGDLIHTRKANYGEDYMIVPLVAGRHEIKIKVICEEYEEEDVQIIILEI